MHRGRQISVSLRTQVGKQRPIHPAKYHDHFTQPDDKLHAQRRRIVNNIYSMSSILESEQYIDKCTKLLMSKMEGFAQTGEIVDLGKWLQM